MPYSQNSELPKSVRDALPSDAQSRFRSVVNNAMGRGLSEDKAFASAWSVVNNGWKKPTGSGKWVRKEINPRTLYIHRKLENSADVISWAKDNGFATTLPAEDMHVTIAFSKEPVDWPEALDDQITIRRRTGRSLERFGPTGEAVVLKFYSPTLESRWQELLDGGASWDWDGYKPHITLSYNGGDLNLEDIRPYPGDLVFGPEVMKEVDEDWRDRVTEKNEDFTKASVFKVNEELGLVFGWAIICKEDGEQYFDLQGDHIPEDSMLKATTDFMLESRMAKEMHDGTDKGVILFAWPMTSEIAKAMGVKTSKTGLMIAYKPSSQEILQKYKDGTYTGFSIGGQRIADEDAE